MVNKDNLQKHIEFIPEKVYKKALKALINSVTECKDAPKGNQKKQGTGVRTR